MKKVLLLAFLVLFLATVSWGIEMVRQKNTATRIAFPIVDADGDVVSSAANLDSEIDVFTDAVSPDGFADCDSEATEVGSSGWYWLKLSATEMNTDYVMIQVKTSTSGAKTQHILIRTIDGDPLKLATVSANYAIDVASGGEVGIDLNNVNGTLDAGEIGADAIGASELADDAIDYATFAGTAPTAWWNEGKTGYGLSTAERKSVADTISGRVYDTLYAHKGDFHSSGDTIQRAASILVASDNIGINWGDITNETSSHNFNSTEFWKVDYLGASGISLVADSVSHRTYDTFYVHKTDFHSSGDTNTNPFQAGTDDVFLSGNYAQIANDNYDTMYVHRDDFKGSGTGATAQEVWEYNISAISGAGYAGNYLNNLPDDPADDSDIDGQLATIDNFVDDLESRLTATRAGYLDNLTDLDEAISGIDDNPWDNPSSDTASGMGNWFAVWFNADYWLTADGDTNTNPFDASTDKVTLIDSSAEDISYTKNNPNDFKATIPDSTRLYFVDKQIISHVVYETLYVHKADFQGAGGDSTNIYYADKQVIAHVVFETLYVHRDDFQGEAAGLTAEEIADTLGNRGYFSGFGVYACTVFTKLDSNRASPSVISTRTQMGWVSLRSIQWRPDSPTSSGSWMSTMISTFQTPPA